MESGSGIYQIKGTGRRRKSSNRQFFTESFALSRCFWLESGQLRPRLYRRHLTAPLQKGSGSLPCPCTHLQCRRTLLQPGICGDVRKQFLAVAETQAVVIVGVSLKESFFSICSSFLPFRGEKSPKGLFFDSCYFTRGSIAHPAAYP